MRRMADSKPVRFISRLVQLTQEGKIDWQIVDTQAGGPILSTAINDRGLRLFKYSETVSNPDYARHVAMYGGISTIVFHRPVPPETIHIAGIALEILDDKGRPAYKFDDTTGLQDLYESASFRAARVDDLMDSVLEIK